MMEERISTTQVVIEITSITSKEDLSGGYIYNSLKVGQLLANNFEDRILEVGQVVDFTEYLEREGVYGHMTVKGQGKVVYVHPT